DEADDREVEHRAKLADARRYQVAGAAAVRVPVHDPNRPDRRTYLAHYRFDCRRVAEIPGERLGLDARLVERRRGCLQPLAIASDEGDRVTLTPKPASYGVRNARPMAAHNDGSRHLRPIPRMFARRSKRSRARTELEHIAAKAAGRAGGSPR